MHLDEIHNASITLTLDPRDAHALSLACGAAALIAQGEPPDIAHFEALDVSPSAVFSLYTALSVALEAMGFAGTTSHNSYVSLSAWRQPLGELHPDDAAGFAAVGHRAKDSSEGEGAP